MRVAFLLALAACGASNGDDVVGPFTGTIHRYYLDDVTVPLTNDQARRLGDDLNRDTTVDNQLGSTLAALSSQGNDITTHARDILAAGAVSSTLEIQADDLMTDDEVGVRFLGSSDDAMATVVGGRLEQGRFISNRTVTSDALGRTTLHLPALVDADPAVFVLDDMELDLTPDGSGGYNALVRGLVGPDIRHVAAVDLMQMFENNPADHADFFHLLDFATSGPVTIDAVENSSLLMSLLRADVRRGDATYVSFGFAAHFAAAAPTTVTDTCHDRVRDAAEAGVDCGGDCLACAGGQTCGSAGDCQSQACNGGTCVDASCHDGVKDGIETDADCGGWECTPCLGGHACQLDSDCTSGRCIAGACS